MLPLAPKSKKSRERGCPIMSSYHYLVIASCHDEHHGIGIKTHEPVDEGGLASEQAGAAVGVF